MKTETITCDCGLLHTEVIGEIEIRLNGMVFHAKYDLCKDLVNSLLPLFVRADATNTTVAAALEKKTKLPPVTEIP